MLDVAGASVLPGLIDSHVHLSVVPGALIRQDPPASLREQRLLQLRAYLACGVTTVLDAGIEPEIARELKQALEKGAPGPTALFLGPTFFAPRATARSAARVETPEQVRAQFDVATVARRRRHQGDARERLDAVQQPPLAQPGDPARDLAGSGAPKASDLRARFLRGRLPAGARSRRSRDHARAPVSRRHALAAVHRPHEIERRLPGLDALGDGCPADRVRAGTPRRSDHADRGDPGNSSRPRAIPRSGRIHAESRVASAAGWMPATARRAAAAYNFSNCAIAEAVADARRALAAEHRAGVPIVVGSDSGNGPIVPLPVSTGSRRCARSSCWAAPDSRQPRPSPPPPARRRACSASRARSARSRPASARTW